MSVTEESQFKLVDGQQTENFFFCPVCQDLMYKPISLCCGHTLCMKCLENLLEKSRPPAKCPSCRKEIKDADRELNVNVALNIILNKVRITCTNEGCCWEGVNGEREHHMINCPFMVVLCSDGCGFSGPRSIMGDHGNSCPRKKKKCQFCDKEFSRTDHEIHEHQCFERSRRCPYECGTLIPGSHVYLHLLNCPNRVIECRVRGCFKTMPQKEDEEHAAKYMATHERLLSREVQHLKSYMLRKEFSPVERKEETAASFQWKTAAFGDIVAHNCGNEKKG